MKKTIIVFIILLIFSTIPGFGEDAFKSKVSGQEILTKTYILKYISPKLAHNILDLYLLKASYDERSRIKMLTVMIRKKDVVKFEELLKKIDKRRKTISFRIFTIIASKEHKASGIDNKDLKKVISELKKVLSFKSFTLDGSSFLTVREGSRHNQLLLPSSVDGLKLRFEDIHLREEGPGKRLIEIGDLRLSDRKTQLISTETSIKENGYLVAGVSKIGKNGDSLVLVINAEIQ
jgi:hypothetical protein